LVALKSQLGKFATACPLNGLKPATLSSWIKALNIMRQSGAKTGVTA
jgi:hypothetical protein